LVGGVYTTGGGGRTRSDEGLLGYHAAVENDVFRRIAQFEDGAGGESAPWLGGGAGLAVGVLGIAGVVAATALLPTVFAYDEPLLSKAACLAWVVVIGVVAAYWRRQRLAAHFQRAHRSLGSADPDERQRGLTEMIVNARRGQAEHGRIARALTAYLRATPPDHPDEAGRRQVAFSILADQTLVMRAKRALDLSGARLVGIRGVGAELRGVRLNGADLTGARLGRADLTGADLRDARLDGADFTGARLDGALRSAG
jgi:hypothetical protein